jgi:hypothetical protein
MACFLWLTVCGLPFTLVIDDRAFPLIACGWPFTLVIDNRAFPLFACGHFVPSPSVLLAACPLPWSSTTVLYTSTAVEPSIPAAPALHVRSC